MANIRKTVRDRAHGRCEYCHLPDAYSVLPFQLDHIRAQKHAGRTTLQNYAWSCLSCNSHKGPNPAGYDPISDSLQRLFNPRSDDWNKHFEWDGARLIGLTPIGRTTIAVLRVNHPDQVRLRSRVQQLGEELD